jgi:hypothetical protein
MIRRILPVATALLACIACTDTTAPKPLAPGSPEFARSGTFHIEKDCGAYGGGAGDSCTITSSTLEQIERWSTITYASRAEGASLNTDVVLDLPGPGNNEAFGHCVINLSPVSVGTVVGECTLSGGTGKFTRLHASVAVSYIGGPNYAWDGSYSFGEGE